MVVCTWIFFIWLVGFVAMLIFAYADEVFTYLETGVEHTDHPIFSLQTFRFFVVISACWPFMIPIFIFGDREGK